MARDITPAQRKAVAKYESSNYDKVLLRIRKDGTPTRDDIRDAAESAGETINTYILHAVRDRMAQDIDTAPMWQGPD